MRTQNEVPHSQPRYAGQAQGPSEQGRLTVMLEGPTVPQGPSISCCRQWDMSREDTLKEL